MEVYFSDVRCKLHSNFYTKLKTIFHKLSPAEKIKKGDLVAIKIHCGEYGNLSYIRPQLVKVIVDEVKKIGAKPFLTDTNTLYVGSRSNAVDHMNCAINNGFTNEVTGAHFIVADGLKGLDYKRVKVDLNNLKEVRVASAIYEADKLICLSHIKGHDIFGYGGAIKNIGMGCVCRPQKQVLHSDMNPSINEKVCQVCYSCIKYCPQGAIHKVMEKPIIIAEKCIGCGECIAICPYKAISPILIGGEDTIQQKTAESALAVLMNKKSGSLFVNFMMDITPYCDCVPFDDQRIVPNIGIMASLDPVSLDQACIDLVNKTRGIVGSSLGNINSQDKFFDVTKQKWTYLLDYAEVLGIGEKSYTLIKID